VRRRALEQFVAKNLHLTAERTGVMIFVSLGERMAELIADEGIASQVEPKVWDQAMAALVEGLKRGEPAAGFAAAVGLCADVLAERFPADPDDNPNELADTVVVLPRP
jgi:putative membrane protein